MSGPPPPPPVPPLPPRMPSFIPPPPIPEFEWPVRSEPEEEPEPEEEAAERWEVVARLAWDGVVAGQRFQTAAFDGGDIFCATNRDGGFVELRVLVCVLILQCVRSCHGFIINQISFRLGLRAATEREHSREEWLGSCPLFC